MYKLHKWTPSGKQVDSALKNAIKMLDDYYLVDRDVMEDDQKIKVLENIADLTYMLLTMQEEVKK
jgi:hypothetical protein